MKKTYSNELLEREQSQPQSVVPGTEFPTNFGSLQSRRTDKSTTPHPTSAWQFIYKTEATHFKFTFVLIFFLRLSLVTKSSVSSLRANITGGSLILRLRHSCLTTSSTVSVGSIRARTVTPSLVVTLFVGTSTTGFAPCPLTGGDMGERVVGDRVVGDLVADCMICGLQINKCHPGMRLSNSQELKENCD